MKVRGVSGLVKRPKPNINVTALVINTIAIHSINRFESEIQSTKGAVATHIATDTKSKF